MVMKTSCVGNRKSNRVHLPSGCGIPSAYFEPLGRIDEEAVCIGCQTSEVTCHRCTAGFRYRLTDLGQTQEMPIEFFGPTWVCNIEADKSDAANCWTRWRSKSSARRQQD